MKQRILILNTGGTLASVASASGLAPGMPSETILKELSPVSRGIEVEIEEFCERDSANISPKDWAAMASRIDEAHEDYSGIVIIHGTDTMAYTSSMLSFMLQNIDIPVVLTGSQLSLTDPIADAMENCRLAFRMAVSGAPGVFVAFNRKVLLGCRASKVRSLSFDAFESINYPEIATVSSLGMTVHRALLPEKKDLYQCRNSFSTDVRVFKLYPGMQAALLSTEALGQCRGVFLESFGLGGIPFMEEDLITPIRALTERGIAVLVGTQCRYEGSNLTVYETGRKALDAGVIEAFDMTSEAAVTKLMWVLGQTDSPKRVKEYFGISLCKEVTIASV